MGPLYISISNEKVLRLLKLTNVYQINKCVLKKGIFIFTHTHTHTHTQTHVFIYIILYSNAPTYAIEMLRKVGWDRDGSHDDWY